MRKLTCFAVAAIAAFPAVSHAQSADAIIDRAAAAYSRLNTIRAEFRQTLTNPLTGSTQTTSGVLLRKKPNLLSVNFESGDRVVADGSTLWLYLPSSVPGQVVRMPYSGANASAFDPAEEFLNSPRARFTVSSAGAATIGGRAAHVITLVPKRPNNAFTSAKVWIDDKDSTIRQFDLESANGLRRHVVITSFTANPSLGRSNFRFAVPRGARVVDQSGLAGVAY
ncbi:MAG TPA: outer membrane lipoprotein carrier protein LolA [Gemmatimonadaceae bacterium]|jgi:outer membrane lipoprotein carrier protein|nr:outer membrane lipoprotein carrier protein LolA [Gemmatimonadaceae bacterium]